MNQIPSSDKTLDWDHLCLLFSNAIDSQTLEIQLTALAKFAKLANQAPESTLIPVIPILVDLLTNPTLQEPAVRILSSLLRRNNPRFSAIIGQAGAIPIILDQLPDSRSVHRTRLLKCLARLVTFNHANRTILAQTDGLEIILLAAIPSSDDASMRFLLEILSALAMLREVRRTLNDLGGLPFIIKAASIGNMASRTRAAHAIGLLGIVRRVRHKLVDYGAVDALAGLLRDGDSSGKIVAGNALGIVSSHVEYLRPVADAGAIPLYMELLQGPEPLGKEIAEDALCVLAVAEENAVSIMAHLVRVLMGNASEEAKATAMDVIWDIAAYKHSVSVVRSSGAVPVLIGFMREGSSDLREKAAGAISRLSYDEGNREAMEEEGAVALLINLVRGDSDELREYAAEALICFAEDPRYSEQVSEVYEIPSFLVIQERLSRIGAADEPMSRSVRLLTVEHLASDLDFI